VPRHRRPHDAQPDESDLHGFSPKVESQAKPTSVVVDGLYSAPKRGI
jgi:hypothetical protein